jgi:hypothetical protein
VFPSPFSSFFLSSPPLTSHASASGEALILLELASAFILLKLAPAFNMLEIAPALSFVICLSTQISWISFNIYRATLRVHGRVLCSLKVEVVTLRYTILHPTTAYTLLPTETTVVLRSRRHHPLRLRTTPHFSVACTRQQRFHVCRRVLALLPLSAFIHFRRWWLLVDFAALGHGEAFLCWRVDYTRHHRRLPSLPIHCVVVFSCFCVVFLLISHTVMGAFLFLLCGLGYSIVGRFPTSRSVWFASSRSWLWIHRYLEVFRSDVFQLRSINFRRPLHHTFHTIGFPALSPSTHRQPLRRSALSRRSMQPTRQIWTPCVLTPPVIFHLRCFLIRLCFLFFLFFNFFSWVLVSVGDPFTRYFVLIFVVPILFHIQISARPSLLKGLFWTGLKASAWVMPLFTTDLVSNPLYADQALALFKVDRAGTFLVLLELKTHHSLLGYHVTSTFGITFSDLGLLLGSPPLCFYVCNPSC